MRQVADLHTPNIVCAGSPAQDAVTRAELTLWRLNDTFKYLADDDDDSVTATVFYRNAEACRRFTCSVGGTY